MALVDLSPALGRALDAITPARVVTVLQDLLAVPSVTGSAAESEAQHELALRYEELGLDTDHWSIDLNQTLKDPGFPGLEAPRSEAWGLVGTWPGTSTDDTEATEPALVLNGHIDVVPLGNVGDWTVGPWAGMVRGGRVLGRGACDMKGGMAAQLVAVEALQQAGVRLRRPLALHSVVGEEDGGLGTFATLARGHRGQAAVVCEPTDGAVIPACAGALTFRLTVPGRSAHGSVRYEGVDAVEKYVLVHLALRRLESRRNTEPHPLMRHYPLPYPLSVGTVHAGDWASTVPDLLIAEGRLGVALGEDPAHARQELEQAVSTVCAGDPWLAEHPIVVSWYGGQFASGVLPEGSPLLAELIGAVTDAHGTAPQVHGAPYGSDLRLLTAAGIPTVHYGPGSLAQAHAPDEWVAVDDLVRVAQTLVLLAGRRCGVA